MRKILVMVLFVMLNLVQHLVFGQDQRIWATYYGGDDRDRPFSINTDSRGNIYMSGATFSASGIAYNGFQNEIRGNSDAFIVKFDSSGIRLWATYYEGGVNVTTDNNGNVYLSGGAMQDTGIASGGFQNNYAGAEDACLIKFDSIGNRIWGTYYGGPSLERSYSTATDIFGNVYLSGLTRSSSGIAYNGIQNSISGIDDAFLVKFDSDGNRLWATYYGGPDYDYGYSVATDIFGNVYLGGKTYSSSLISLGGFQNTYSGGGDAFLVKFDSDGNRLWATYYGGTSGDICNSIATDTFGNVFMSGITNSSFGISADGFQNNYAGGNDAFLVKFNSSGERLWATYYGGAEEEEEVAIATDNNGNVFLAGDTYSTAGIAYSGFQDSLVGQENEFIVKFDSNGIQTCATYFGQLHDEYGLVAADKFGNVYLSGATNSNSGIAFDGFQNSYGGGTQDAYLVKFSSCEPTLSGNISYSYPKCKDDCDGSATINPAYGIPPYSFLWSNSETTQTVTGLCAGNYSIIVTDSIGNTTTANITIEEGYYFPISITQHGDTLVATNAPNYQWYVNDTIISEANTQDYLMLQGGNYYVITIIDSCTFISPVIEVILESISENNFLQNISLFPNPATTQLTITGYTPAYLKLCNTLGQTVAEATNTLPSREGSKGCVIDISSLPQGLYVLQLFDAKGGLVKAEKVVKE